MRGEKGKRKGWPNQGWGKKKLKLRWKKAAREGVVVGQKKGKWGSRGDQLYKRTE